MVLSMVLLHTWCVVFSAELLCAWCKVFSMVLLTKQVSGEAQVLSLEVGQEDPVRLQPFSSQTQPPLPSCQVTVLSPNTSTSILRESDVKSSLSGAALLQALYLHTQGYISSLSAKGPQDPYIVLGE